MSSPDYRLRPAKHVERLLIVEAFRRLRAFQDLAGYGYVGFGAQYFVDFALLHRALGISNMVSLEREAKLFDRCVFNRPFDSVQVLKGTSSKHFAAMSFNEPTIAWADYTGRLNAAMLGDVDTLCLRLPPSSVMLVTVNVDADQVESPPHGRLDLLKSRIGEKAVPLGTKDADLDGWKNAGVIRQVIDDHVQQALMTRADGTRYEQLFNFRYRDTARMLTVGGLLINDALQDAFDRCEWATVKAYKPGPGALNIELPLLTMREMAHLEDQLPHGAAAMSAPGLTTHDLQGFAEFYRYYPRYALVDV